MQVRDVPVGDVVDLGCGDGAVAAALRARFPERRLLGVDASSAMLAKARGYDATTLDDIAEWVPESPPAVIFSNAALHWLPDHATLLPRLAATLGPGGTLAVQMPRQHEAPSHRLAREIAGQLAPTLFSLDAWTPQVGEPAWYYHLLTPLGHVEVWETTYLQHLAPVADGHPVRAFTEATLLLPYAERLGAAYAEFVSVYDAALVDAYPPKADGSVLFPFRRLFLICQTG